MKFSISLINHSESWLTCYLCVFSDLWRWGVARLAKWLRNVQVLLSASNMFSKNRPTKEEDWGQHWCGISMEQDLTVWSEVLSPVSLSTLCGRWLWWHFVINRTVLDGKNSSQQTRTVAMDSSVKTQQKKKLKISPYCHASIQKTPPDVSSAATQPS